MRATLSRYLMYFQTILVQDSDVQRRTQIRYTLSLKGYKVLEAGSPKDAEIICAMKEVSIDLVIRETETPDNFHWPMWRRQAPTIALAAFCDAPDRGSRVDFWRLPFSPDYLLLRVQYALAQAQQSQRVEDQA